MLVCKASALLSDLVRGGIRDAQVSTLWRSAHVKASCISHMPLPSLPDKSLTTAV